MEIIATNPSALTKCPPDQHQEITLQLNQGAKIGVTSVLEEQERYLLIQTAHIGRWYVDKQDLKINYNSISYLPKINPPLEYTNPLVSALSRFLQHYSHPNIDEVIKLWTSPPPKLTERKLNLKVQEYLTNICEIPCRFKTNISWEEIKLYIRNGHPVIYYGSLSASKHHTILEGFNDDRNLWKVYDPIGQWTRTGYFPNPKRVSLYYPYRVLEQNSLAGITRTWAILST